METTSPVIKAIFDAFTPLCKDFAGGKNYAIAVGGSYGKGKYDKDSDIDFRLFCDDDNWSSPSKAQWKKDYFTLMDNCKEKGYKIDGVWIRKTEDINKALDEWFDGKIDDVAKYIRIKIIQEESYEFGTEREFTLQDDKAILLKCTDNVDDISALGKVARKQRNTV